jgi:hypothetical protein
MLPSGLWAVAVLKIKTIMKVTNWCGWCYVKAPFKDACAAVKFSNWWDSGTNFPLKWITIRLTSLSSGSRIWVKAKFPITCLYWRLTPTSSTLSSRIQKTQSTLSSALMNMIECWLTPPTGYKEPNKLNKKRGCTCWRWKTTRIKNLRILHGDNHWVNETMKT